MKHKINVWIMKLRITTTAENSDSQKTSFKKNTIDLA
jgi:hypothetical protein